MEEWKEKDLKRINSISKSIFELMPSDVTRYSLTFTRGTVVPVINYSVSYNSIDINK